MAQDPNLHRRRLTIISRLLARHGAEPAVDLDDIGDLSEADAAGYATAESDRFAKLLQVEAEGLHRVPAPPVQKPPKERDVIVPLPKRNGSHPGHGGTPWGKRR